MDLIVSKMNETKIKQALLMGVELAPQATQKSSFYNKGDDNSMTVDAAILAMGSVGLDIPLLVAASVGSGYFTQRALLVELTSGKRVRGTAIVSPKDWADGGFGKFVVGRCLERLDATAGTPYVLRLFVELTKAKANNMRTRNAMLNYIWSHENLEFFAVKYHAKLRMIIRHAYGLPTLTRLITSVKKIVVNKSDFSDIELYSEFIGKYGGNNKGDLIQRVFLFLFGESNWGVVDGDEYPVLRQYREAMNDIDGCNLIPIEVLEGLIGNPKHPQHMEKWSTPEKRAATRAALKATNQTRTEKQKVREISQDKSLGVETKIDFKRVNDPIVILKAAYENGVISDEMHRQLETLAILNSIDIPYNEIGIVVDKSYSMLGDCSESKNLPRARAQFAELVLKNSASATVVHTETWATNLASPLVDLLLDKPNIEAVFIISDGYENAPDGLLEATVEFLRKHGKCPALFHVNPVNAAEFSGGLRKFKGITPLPAEHTALKGEFMLALAKEDSVAWITSIVRSLEGEYVKN